MHQKKISIREITAIYERENKTALPYFTSKTLSEPATKKAADSYAAQDVKHAQQLFSHHAGNAEQINATLQGVDRPLSPTLTFVGIVADLVDLWREKVSVTEKNKVDRCSAIRRFRQCFAQMKDERRRATKKEKEAYMHKSLIDHSIVFSDTLLDLIEESVDYGRQVLARHNCTAFELRINLGRIGTDKCESFFRYVRQGQGGGDAATARQVIIGAVASNIYASQRQLDERSREARESAKGIARDRAAKRRRASTTATLNVEFDPSHNFPIVNNNNTTTSNTRRSVRRDRKSVV